MTDDEPYTPERRRRLSDTLDAISPDTTGRWRVETENGTVHVWDMDAQSYTRYHPKGGRNPMQYDGTPLVLDPALVSAWPEVGKRFAIAVLLTKTGEMVHWKFRISSHITAIRRDDS